MRNLSKNKTPLVALNFIAKSPIVDSQGYKTGEYRLTYGNEIHLRAHISGAKGSAGVEMFGVDVAYDKTIIITKNEFDKYGFDDNTVFFIDKKPAYKEDGTPLYDYKVVRKSQTLNEVAIAVKQVRNEN